MPQQLKKSQVAGILKQLVTKQGGVCAVCTIGFTRSDPAVLDHCHDSGFIRGALHRSCNGAEGRVKSKGRMGHKGVSSALYIIGLGKYLEKHLTPQYKFIHPSHMTVDQKRLAVNKRARTRRKKATG